MCVAVCIKMGMCSLLSLSAISINSEVAASEHDGMEAVPDWMADVHHNTGVLGAETVGCRHIDACIVEGKIDMPVYFPILK